MTNEATQLSGNIYYSYQYGIQLDVEGDENLYGDVVSQVKDIAKRHYLHQKANYSFLLENGLLSGEYSYNGDEGILFYQTYNTKDENVEDTQETIEGIMESVVDVYENYGSQGAAFDDFTFSSLPDYHETTIHKLRDEDEVSYQDFGLDISKMVADIGSGTFAIQVFNTPQYRYEQRVFALLHYLLFSNVSVS